MHWDSISLISLRRPSEAAWSGAGASRPRRAEWGWGGVGLATRIGQVGAECGRVGPSRAG